MPPSLTNLKNKFEINLSPSSFHRFFFSSLRRRRRRLSVVVSPSLSSSSSSSLRRRLRLSVDPSSSSLRLFIVVVVSQLICRFYVYSSHSLSRVSDLIKVWIISFCYTLSRFCYILFICWWFEVDFVEQWKFCASVDNGSQKNLSSGSFLLIWRGMHQSFP